MHQNSEPRIIIFLMHVLIRPGKHIYNVMHPDTLKHNPEQGNISPK